MYVNSCYIAKYREKDINLRFSLHVYIIYVASHLNVLLYSLMSYTMQSSIMNFSFTSQLYVLFGYVASYIYVLMLWEDEKMS